jgi:hypothetical protein
MLSQSTDICEIFKTLARHSDILAQAYYGDGVQMDEETSESIDVLVTNGALSPYGNEGFMLSNDIRAFLDHSTHRRRGYGAGGDILGEIDRYSALLVDYESAISVMRTSDATTLRSEITRSIFAIREQINEEMDRFRHVVETRFSDVSTMAEKQNQNTYYLNRAEKILVAVEHLEKATRIEHYNELVREVEVETYREIGSRYQGWVASLSSIQERLREFLFQFRQIEEGTKKVYALTRFFADKSDDDIADMLTTIEHETDWTAQIEESAACPEPDIEDDETRLRLAQLFSEMKPRDEVAVPAELAIGKPVDLEGSNTVEDDIEEFEQALLDFLDHVDTARDSVSSLEWLKGEDRRLLIPEEWLEQVLTWAVGDRNCGRVIDIKERASKTPRCGNVEVGDVLVCRAA